MEFSEFKKSLESEARVENIRLKEQISRLTKENKKYREEFAALGGDVEDVIKDLKSLTERCYATNHGVLCMFCTLATNTCAHKAEMDEIYKACKEDKNPVSQLIKFMNEEDIEEGDTKGENITEAVNEKEVPKKLSLMSLYGQFKNRRRKNKCVKE